MNEKMFKEYLIDMKFEQVDCIDIIHELKAYGKIDLNGIMWEYESGMFLCLGMLEAFEQMLDDNDKVLQFPGV